MLAQLGSSCLLLAVALLGPGPRARAMKGKIAWGQIGTGRRGRRAGRQQPGSQEVSMWEARKQEALLEELVESRIDLFLRWEKTVFTECLLCAGCFICMIACKLHNKLQGGY